MQKISLGFICYGIEYSEMSIVSLYSFFLSLNKDNKKFDEIVEEILIVTDNSGQLFVNFAKSLHANVRIIKPSKWDSFNLPPYYGNFATYWKFDLLCNLSLNKTLIYLDSDAFVIGNFDLDFILKRINVSEEKDSLLMVPSHRPVLERSGYLVNRSPYDFYNAGFAVITLRKKFTINKLIEHYRDFYPNSYQSLIWGDQDLINSYFSDCIIPLPFRYNISTGMLRKDNFDTTKLNYLAISEFKNIVIAHASGGVLKSKKYYPYRNQIISIATKAISKKEINESFNYSLKKFILFNSGPNVVSKLRRFLGWSIECSPYLYHDEIYWKILLRKLIT